MVLTHAGLVCSVGLQAAAACAAMRAGIAGLADLPYFDQSGEPIVGAAVPGLTATGDDRLLMLLEKAVDDCLKSAAVTRTQSLPLLVGLAEPGRPGGADRVAGDLVSRLQTRLGRRFSTDFSRCLSGGHTAGFELLAEARRLLEQGDAVACLVAAVDSYVASEALEWIERHGRLKTPGNSDGLIPGEAAAAVLVTSEKAAGSSRLLAEVLGLGFGLEPASVLSDEPLRGEGLAAATKAALAAAQLQMHDVAFRLSDVTGESYGFKEQALVVARLMRQRREQQPLWHAADSIGDCGAAAGLCHLIMAATAWHKNYAPGPVAACFGSAVGAQRAAAILRGRQSAPPQP